MIRIALLDNGEFITGGRELLDRNLTMSTVWIDISGESEHVEQELFKRFGCHPLAIQDSRRFRHPPKCEIFNQQIFLLLRGIQQHHHGVHYQPMQIAYFIGDHFLLTHHHQASVSIDAWWQKQDLNTVLADGPMMLFSRLSNSLGLLYLEMLLEFEPEISRYEDELLEHADDALLRELIANKTQLRKQRRTHDYHENALKTLNQYVQSSERFDHDTVHALNDSYEKFERIHNLSSLYYDLAGDLIDGHISLTSHQLNDTMRMLTVLTAIFVPLGFLAGVYGMNFDNMPELHYAHGYQVLVAFMVVLAVSLLALFKRNKWL